MMPSSDSHTRSARSAGHGHTRAATTAAFALLVLASAACGRDETTAPIDPVEGTLTVDASAGWAYVSLESQAVVSPGDAASSTAWDIAFNATNVMLNGGQAGPGGVTGYCLCQNSATNPDAATVLAYTPESEQADFAVVTASMIPAASSFLADELNPAIEAWYSGTAGAGASAATAKAWLVRLRDGKGFAKLRVAGITSPTAATPGTVTLEYAVQATEQAPLGTTGTLVVAVPATGSARVDLLGGGAVTTSATDWDLRFDGWTLRLNGGASGSGKVAAYLTDEPFAAITTAVTAAQAYSSDAYAGVFASDLWYRYNLTGQHDISPTFDVYLVRRGSRVYKLQITDYYGPAGESRRITIRHALLAD